MFLHMSFWLCYLFSVCLYSVIYFGQFLFLSFQVYQSFLLQYLIYYQSLTLQFLLQRFFVISKISIWLYFISYIYVSIICMFLSTFWNIQNIFIVRVLRLLSVNSIISVIYDYFNWLIFFSPGYCSDVSASLLAS